MPGRACSASCPACCGRARRCTSAGPPPRTAAQSTKNPAPRRPGPPITRSGRAERGADAWRASCSSPSRGEGLRMLPLGDDREAGPPALMTMALVAVNVLAFFVELGQHSEGALQSFIQAWGVVPREYSAGRDLAPHIPAPFWTTLFTSMFLHGGWAHLGGNMLYLWIFGDNLERRLGAARFLVFYLVCGVAAAFAHILFNAQSSVPTVGASGAISGVLGGYLILFPKNRVRVLVRG